MRDYKVMIRVLEDERRVLESAAEASGLPTATWARNVLLRQARARDGQSSPKHRQNLPLLSVFCGPGGLDEGFRMAGFTTALAFDNDKDCVQTFSFNHRQGKAYQRDISSLTLNELDQLFGEEFAPVGVIGGPPCQSFSVSNVHQSDDDPRHSLPEQYARLLRELNERNPISFFLFENVPGLLGKRHVDRYTRFKKLFERAGFQVHEKTLDAKHFGVPQERERIFIVGLNNRIHPGK